ncbi:S1/P1 nuclease [Parvularcula sp. LCG005]|uniref:S1/P1 nuclease n=1 Tax=Parvularcula sp. LCG005 TaxID=3078805 RepID=UPI00294248AD|nr:S1/P1 nuclease [Parvularcula sp. LCG005]WOI53252.1 S1/P1 nuclease [Parvularcula sp. LCG005]
MLRLFLTVLTCLGLLFPSMAQAYDKIGHRVAAAMAMRLLDDNAKAAIEDILGPVTLAELSNYPDEQRSNPDEFWRRTANPWHYVTVPEGQTYAEAGAPEEGDAYTALQKYTAVLKDSKASKEDKYLALAFVVHIIADLHQPLHVGDGSDRGGNDIMVTWFGEVTQLHWVWDVELIEYERLSYTEWTDWAFAKLTPQQIEEWSVTDPLVWIAESNEIRPSVYPEPRDRNLRWDYIYEQRETVHTRLSQAGVRTAAYLNDVFGD